jgi:hypothetical protein
VADNMRDTLMQRWFGGGATASHEEQQEAEEAIDRERAKWYGLVNSQGFKELDSWLTYELDQCEVCIGSHEEMLTTAGMRKGLKKVALKLQEVKQFVAKLQEE